MKTILTFILLITVSSVAQAEQVGDMDDDSKVGLQEAIIALRVTAGLEPGVPLGEYTPASGNATASDVLMGKTFSNDEGADKQGVMPTHAIDPESPTIDAGYYIKTSLPVVEQDLQTNNIRSGKIIFGVKGKTEVVDTSTGDATDEQILKGKKAWVDGRSITGSLGLFWGCRPDHQYWSYTDCHTDCNIAISDPALFWCATRCSSIRGLLQDANVSEFICAGPVGFND